MVTQPTRMGIRRVFEVPSTAYTAPLRDRRLPNARNEPTLLRCLIEVLLPE